LARLAKIKKEREEAAAKRKAEQEGMSFVHLTKLVYLFTAVSQIL
jgi:hypothetical protein